MKERYHFPFSLIALKPRQFFQSCQKIFNLVGVMNFDLFGARPADQICMKYLVFILITFNIGKDWNRWRRGGGGLLVFLVLVIIKRRFKIWVCISGFVLFGHGLNKASMVHMFQFSTTGTSGVETDMRFL